MPDPEERDSPQTGDNQLIVDALRKAFTVAADRLTPEVEPATIYLPYLTVSDADSPAEERE